MDELQPNDSSDVDLSAEDDGDRVIQHSKLTALNTRQNNVGQEHCGNSEPPENPLATGTGGNHVTVHLREIPEALINCGAEKLDGCSVHSLSLPSLTNTRESGSNTAKGIHGRGEQAVVNRVQSDVVLPLFRDVPLKDYVEEWMNSENNNEYYWNNAQIEGDRANELHTQTDQSERPPTSPKAQSSTVSDFAGSDLENSEYYWSNEEIEDEKEHALTQSAKTPPSPKMQSNTVADFDVNPHIFAESSPCSSLLSDYDEESAEVAGVMAHQQYTARDQGSRLQSRLAAVQVKKKYKMIQKRKRRPVNLPTNYLDMPSTSREAPEPRETAFAIVNHMGTSSQVNKKIAQNPPRKTYRNMENQACESYQTNITRATSFDLCEPSSSGKRKAKSQDILIDDLSDISDDELPPPTPPPLPDRQVLFRRPKRHNDDLFIRKLTPCDELRFLARDVHLKWISLARAKQKLKDIFSRADRQGWNEVNAEYTHSALMKTCAEDSALQVVYVMAKEDDDEARSKVEKRVFDAGCSIATQTNVKEDELVEMCNDSGTD